MKRAYLHTHNGTGVSNGKPFSKSILKKRNLRLVEDPTQAEVCVVYGKPSFCGSTLKTFFNKDSSQQWLVVLTEEGELPQDVLSDKRVEMYEPSKIS